MFSLLAPSLVGMATATAFGYSSLGWLLGAGVAGQLLIVVSPFVWFFIEANSLVLSGASLAYMGWTFYGTSRFTALFLVGVAALMVAQSASSRSVNPSSDSNTVTDWFWNKSGPKGQLKATDARASKAAQGPWDWGWQGAR